jgi:uncharacterized protein YciI
MPDLGVRTCRDPRGHADYSAFQWEVRAVRFAYFYLMQDRPQAVQAVAPQHAAYWRHTTRSHPGGPFTDRPGGLITFEADSARRAAELVAADPFVRRGLLSSSWLKEWTVV